MLARIAGWRNPGDAAARRRECPIGMLNQQTLQPGHYPATVCAGQVEVRTARRVRMPATRLAHDVTLQQIELLAEFPHAPTQRVEQRALAKNSHPGADLTQPGRLLAESGDLATPVRRIPGE